MGIQTKAAAQAMLDKYYQALEDLAEGKSFTMATEAGTRVLTQFDIPMVNDQITRLERRVTTPDGMTHNFSVANFNHPK